MLLDLIKEWSTGFVTNFLANNLSIIYWRILQFSTRYSNAILKYSWTTISSICTGRMIFCKNFHTFASIIILQYLYFHFGGKMAFLLHSSKIPISWMKIKQAFCKHKIFKEPCQLNQVSKSGTKNCFWVQINTYFVQCILATNFYYEARKILSSKISFKWPHLQNRHICQV